MYVCTQKETIRERLKEIETLKARIKELEKENKELKKKLEEADKYVVLQKIRN